MKIPETLEWHVRSPAGDLLAATAYALDSALVAVFSGTGSCIQRHGETRYVVPEGARLETGALVQLAERLREASYPGTRSPDGE